ncbi:MAG: DUF2088 domain-containing protein, partial [Candidatus Eremiobacteraeota bacterium]|nr:DUF2088 domain-containing protein [Candidatus Eremiobacteraeota bacterium]
MSEQEVAASLDDFAFEGQRLLVVIPDGTRTAPMPMLYRQLCRRLLPSCEQLDFLIALGTHPLMSEAEIERLVGPLQPGTRVFNHRWDRPDTFVEVGKISEEETWELSEGRLRLEVPIRVNRMLLEYDRVLLLGPVFPHEVAGFSGGSKYIFPGVGGAEVIHFTHWLGALVTSFATIGVRDTAVRRTIELAAERVPCERTAICLVTSAEGLHGMFIGPPRQAWSQAAALSAEVHVRYHDQPYQRVLSLVPERYQDLWTGAKGMYKVEPVVADGGEVVIHAPHISEVSYTHGHLLDQIGYHVRDYFTKQWERFRDVPWGVLAHSTHLRG